MSIWGTSDVPSGASRFFGNGTVHVLPCTLITNHIVYKHGAPVLTPFRMYRVSQPSALRHSHKGRPSYTAYAPALDHISELSLYLLCRGLITLMAPSSFIHWVSVCLISEPVLFSSVYGGWFLNKVDLGHGKGTSGVADSLSTVRLL